MSFFADVSILDDLPEIWWVIKNFGPWAVLVIVFIWRDFRRERRLTNRIDKLEDEFREVILPLVEETATVIATNTEALKQNAKIMERCFLRD